MIIMSFLHWTTKSLCRRGEDSCAFKCEKDTWCAHSIEEIAWCWGHLLIFCSLSAKWSPQQTYPQLWRALNNYFLHRHCFAVHKTSQKTLSALQTTFFAFFNEKVGTLTHEAVMSHCLCRYEEKSVQVYYRHSLPTFYSYSCVKSTDVVDRCEL